MFPRSALPLLAIAPLTLALAAPPSQAAWPHLPTVNLPFCTATGSQFAPVAVPDGAGGAFTAWADVRGVDQDIFVQHLLASGRVDPAWPADGLLICTAAGDQTTPAITSDGGAPTGGGSGAIIAWSDYRGGTGGDLYAQRVLSTGAVDPGWPVNGVAVCTASGPQLYPAIAGDGAGGAIITWSDLRSVDTDVYVQHVLPTGAVDGAWPANGRALCTASGYQNFPRIVPDDAGGAIVAWRDPRSGDGDIYAHHVLPTGAADPSWTPNGSAICVQPFDQGDPGLVADGDGGAVLAWHDLRNSSDNDIYAHHVRSTGGVDPNWPSNGLLVCGASSPQWNPVAVPDGAGGAILSWYDYRSGLNFDVYAHHVLASGAVDGAWPADGRALCTATNNQHENTTVPDGSGGAIVAWSDARSGAFDIYAQHVLSSGAVDPNWPADGRALSTAVSYQETPVGVSDAAGGAIVAWVDGRRGNPDLYAQRIARFGVPGTPEPEIAEVGDVPNDQGGRAKVSWYASWVDLEVEPFSGIREVDQYEVWRSVPAASPALMAPDSRIRASFAEVPGKLGRTFVVAPNRVQVYAWEYLETLDANHYIPAYSYLAATAGDSVGTYNPKTVFMVVARNTSASKYWLSQPDSGYSVDNLAPATPGPLAGNYRSGATHLHWNPNREDDFSNYRLYRGGTADFVPGPTNLIASPPDTGHTDAGPAGGYYKLSALDVHGNQSGFALLTPTQTGGVGESGTPALALANPIPNPSSRSVGLSYTLPREGRASLGIFDLAGRRVRRLMDGVSPAGEHTLSWDLLDDDGSRVRGGLYFLRLETEHGTLSRRLAIAR